MIEIDGSHGEGGGQLLRTAVALAAVTGTPIRITNIRAGRSNPGLAPQHVAAVRSVAEVCDGSLTGAAVKSKEMTFVPGRIRGGAFEFDIGTAGSITLVLQALLPVLASGRDVAHVRIVGGTDVRAAPPLDYFRFVLLPLLGRIGVRATLQSQRRGYYPRGGGIVALKIEPDSFCPFSTFSKIEPDSFSAATPGSAQHVDGISHVANLPSHIAERMAASAAAALPDQRPLIRTEVLAKDQAIGQGGAIVIWAETRASVLGAGRVAQRGVPAEVLGGEAGAELAADLAAGAALDVHAADQMLSYLALGGGASTFTTREVTSHARTAMWLIEQFLPVRFLTQRSDNLWRVSVAPSE